MLRFSDRLRVVIGDQAVNHWAEDHGLSPQTVHEWIKHDRTPRGSSMKALVAATGIPIDWWISGEGQPPVSVVGEPFSEYTVKLLDSSTVNTKVLAQIISGLEKALIRHRKDLPPEKKSELVAVLYEHVMKTGVADTGFIERVTKLAM